MQLLKTYIKKHLKTLWLTLGLAAISQIFSLLDPQIFRLVIDKFANNKLEYTLNEYMLGAGMLLLGTVSVAFVSRLAKNFQDYYSNVIVQRVGTALYTDAIAHAFSLPYAVFEDERSGAILERFQKARENLQGFITSSISVLFVTLVGIIFVLIYTFFIHWSIGLFFILIIPSLSYITFTLGRKIKNIQTKIVLERASLLGASTETLRNVELVKSLGLETQEVERLAHTNNEVLKLELLKIRAVRKLSFIQGTIINFLRTSLLFLMLILLYLNILSLGELFAILFYSFFIFNPLYELGTVSTNYYEAKASLESVDDFLKQTSEPIPDNAIKINSIDNISFKKVYFNYQNKETEALADISFDVKKGETIAFVGPSGSGKSTIIKLLTGLYKPKSGEITINNNPIDTIDIAHLRRSIGLVLQETQLFAGTIRDNLIFSNPNANEEDLIKSLTQAEAYYLVERSKEGLASKIGEGGIKLSGGERQRLAIARALVRNPEILIFDEATSSLDSITERNIATTIKKLSGKNITQILVAHRLGTIIHADKIFVLQKGSIIESGNHEELLAKHGLYEALYKEQLAGY